MSSGDSTEKSIETADYWSERYTSGQAAWDIKDETSVFRNLRERGEFPIASVVHGRAARLFVPGCGFGYDALAFARSGYDVTAVDFAAEPLEVLKANAARDGADMHILQADIFALPGERFTNAFDAVLEYTCYCAIAVERRAEYANILANALVPGGCLVALLFPTDGRSGGPPFAIDPEETISLFASVGLPLEASRIPEDSHPRRAGAELLTIFRKPV